MLDQDYLSLPQIKNEQSDREFETDDFKTVFHPCSNKKKLYQAFQDFGDFSAPIDPVFLDPEPWKLFNSRADFNFS